MDTKIPISAVRCIIKKVQTRQKKVKNRMCFTLLIALHDIAFKEKNKVGNIYKSTINRKTNNKIMEYQCV